MKLPCRRNVSMKRLLTLFIVVISFYPCVMYSEKKRYQEVKTYTIGGVKYTFDKTKTLYFYENSAVMEGHLVSNHQVVAGDIDYMFEKGKIFFYKSGKLKRGRLSSVKQVKIGGVTYTFDDFLINFYESGKIKNGYLASKVKVSLGKVRYEFQGGGFHDHLPYNERYFYKSGLNFISFYESGKVKSGYLTKKKAVEIGGVLYWFRARWNSLGFYESGQVKEGMLAHKKAVVIGDNLYTFAEGHRVNLMQSRGAMEGGITLFSERNHPYYRERVHEAGGTFLEKVVQHPSGPRNGKAVMSQKERTRLIQVNSSSSSGGEVMAKALYPPPGRHHWANMSFYEEGKVMRGNLSSNHAITIKGVKYWFIGHNGVYFHKNGQVIQAKLGASVLANGKAYTQDEWIRFDKDGKIASSSHAFDVRWTGE